MKKTMTETPEYVPLTPEIIDSWLRRFPLPSNLSGDKGTAGTESHIEFPSGHRPFFLTSSHVDGFDIDAYNGDKVRAAERDCKQAKQAVDTYRMSTRRDDIDPAKDGELFAAYQKAKSALEAAQQEQAKAEKAFVEEPYRFQLRMELGHEPSDAEVQALMERMKNDPLR